MKLSRLLPTLVLLFCLNSLSAQDIHFTLFNMSPLTMNPALTGAFEGTVRLGGIYRGQWFTTDANMSTPSFYVDAPIIRGFRDQDWVGVGLVFASDKAGTHSLQTSIGGLSASYHLGLNKKGTSHLTIGGQYNTASRKIDYKDIVTDQTIDPLLGGQGLELDDDGVEFVEEQDKSYSDINAGLLFRTAIDKETSLELGMSALHLGSPDAALDSMAGGDRKLTFLSHGKFERQLSEKWSIAPTFLFQTTQGGGSEISLQAWVGNQINPDMKLNFGLGYRVSDSAKFLFGVDYKDVSAALSYDLNISSANVITNYQGGFEIAAYYIIKVYKTPELTPKVLCPRF